MQTTNESPIVRPDIPVCIGGEPHNFQPMADRHVYCTKCAANVRFTKPKKDKKNA